MSGRKAIEKHWFHFENGKPIAIVESDRQAPQKYLDWKKRLEKVNSPGKNKIKPKCIVCHTVVLNEDIEKETLAQEARWLEKAKITFNEDRSISWDSGSDSDRSLDADENSKLQKLKVTKQALIVAMLEAAQIVTLESLEVEGSGQKAVDPRKATEIGNRISQVKKCMDLARSFYICDFDPKLSADNITSNRCGAVLHFRCYQGLYGARASLLDGEQKDPGPDFAFLEDTQFTTWKGIECPGLKGLRPQKKTLAEKSYFFSGRYPTEVGGQYLPHKRYRSYELDEEAWSEYESWLVEHWPEDEGSGMDKCVYCGNSVTKPLSEENYGDLKKDLIARCNLALNRCTDAETKKRLTAVRKQLRSTGSSTGKTAAKLDPSELPWQEQWELWIEDYFKWLQDTNADPQKRQSVYPHLTKMLKTLNPQNPREKGTKRSTQKPNSKFLHFNFCSASIRYPTLLELQNPGTRDLKPSTESSFRDRGACGGAYHTLCSQVDAFEEGHEAHYFCWGPNKQITSPFSAEVCRDKIIEQIVGTWTGNVDLDEMHRPALQIEEYLDTILPRRL